MIKVHKVAQHDLAKVLQLQYKAYQSEAELFHDMNIPPLRQTLQEVEAEYNRGVILVAEEDDIIVGSVRAYCENDSVYIGKLFVHPDLQGKGIGTKLLKSMEEEYPGKRYELFTSTRSKSNQRLYEHLGYKPFREKKINEELHFVYLEKTQTM